MMKKIEGNRIYLSPVSIEDLSKYAEFMNDMEMSLLTGTFHGVYGIEEERSYFQPQEEKVQLAIRRKDTDEIIGLVELMDISPVNRSSEIGISIGETHNRSKGYGREAMNLMLEFGFFVLNLESIYLTVLEKNTRALKLYKSLGFQLAGCLRNHRYIAGQYYDVLYMDLLKQDYKGHFLIDKLETFL